MGGRFGGEWIHVYVWLSPFAVHLLISYACVHAKSPWSCPTLCDPMDYRSPGSFVHGIFQARTLKWVAISSSRGFSWPSDLTRVSYFSCISRHFSCISRQVSCIAGGFFTSEPPEKPPSFRKSPLNHQPYSYNFSSTNQRLIIIVKKWDDWICLFVQFYLHFY